MAGGAGVAALGSGLESAGASVSGGGKASTGAASLADGAIVPVSIGAVSVAAERAIGAARSGRARVGAALVTVWRVGGGGAITTGAAVWLGVLALVAGLSGATTGPGSGAGLLSRGLSWKLLSAGSPTTASCANAALAIVSNGAAHRPSRFERKRFIKFWTPRSWTIVHLFSPLAGKCRHASALAPPTRRTASYMGWPRPAEWALYAGSPPDAAIASFDWRSLVLSEAVKPRSITRRASSCALR